MKMKINKNLKKKLLKTLTFSAFFVAPLILFFSQNEANNPSISINQNARIVSENSSRQVLYDYTTDATIPTPPLYTVEVAVDRYNELVAFVWDATEDQVFAYILENGEWILSSANGFSYITTPQTIDGIHSVEFNANHDVYISTLNNGNHFGKYDERTKQWTFEPIQIGLDNAAVKFNIDGECNVFTQKLKAGNYYSNEIWYAPSRSSQFTEVVLTGATDVNTTLFTLNEETGKFVILCNGMGFYENSLENPEQFTKMANTIIPPPTILFMKIRGENKYMLVDEEKDLHVQTLSGSSEEGPYNLQVTGFKDIYTDSIGNMYAISNSRVYMKGLDSSSFTQQVITDLSDSNIKLEIFQASNNGAFYQKNVLISKKIKSVGGARPDFNWSFQSTQVDGSNPAWNDSASASQEIKTIIEANSFTSSDELIIDDEIAAILNEKTNKDKLLSFVNENRETISHFEVEIQKNADATYDVVPMLVTTSGKHFFTQTVNDVLVNIQIPSPVNYLYVGIGAGAGALLLALMTLLLILGKKGLLNRNSNSGNPGVKKEKKRKSKKKDEEIDPAYFENPDYYKLQTGQDLYPVEEEIIEEVVEQQPIEVNQNQYETVEQEQYQNYVEPSESVQEQNLDGEDAYVEIYSDKQVENERVAQQQIELNEPNQVVQVQEQPRLDPIVNQPELQNEPVHRAIQNDPQQQQPIFIHNVLPNNNPYVTYNNLPQPWNSQKPIISTIMLTGRWASPIFQSSDQSQASSSTTKRIEEMNERLQQEKANTKKIQLPKNKIRIPTRLIDLGVDEDGVEIKH